MDLKRINSAQASSADAMRTQGIFMTRKANNIGAMNSTTACELGLMGAEQSTKITIELTNNNAEAIIIPFGTPLGLADDVGFYPNLNGKLLSSPIASEWFNALADLVDNQGINATFLQAINKRFVRNPIYVANMEIVTDDTALGQQQRRQSTTRLLVPYNSVNDSRSQQGYYKPVFTEFTGNQVLDSKGVVFGDFTGILYPLLAGSTAGFNISLQGVNVPTFKHNTNCD